MLPKLDKNLENAVRTSRPSPHPPPRLRPPKNLPTPTPGSICPSGNGSFGVLRVPPNFDKLRNEVGAQVGKFMKMQTFAAGFLAFLGLSFSAYAQAQPQAGLIKTADDERAF